MPFDPEVPPCIPLDDELPCKPEVPGGNPPAGDPDEGKLPVPGGNPPGWDPPVPLVNPVKLDSCCPVDRNFDGSTKEGINGEDPPVFETPDEDALVLDPEPWVPPLIEKLGSINDPGCEKKVGCCPLADEGEPPA